MDVLLPDDSPLRNPPFNLDPVQKASWDAARFAFDMTHVSYVRLVAVLEEIGHVMRQQKRTAHQPTIALLDAWSVVDNLWRLHNVLRKFRGLKKSPELEVHLRAIATVEDLRNGVQHLDGKFVSIAKSGRPVLGTLSWVWTPDEPLRGGFSMAVAAGAMREGWIPVINPIGRTFHRPIGMVTLAAFNKEVDLTALVVRVVDMAKGLDRGARTAVQGTTAGGADAVFAMVFTLGESADVPSSPSPSPSAAAPAVESEGA